MTDKYITQQENFWAGEFGNEYVSRSQGEEIINSNIDFLEITIKENKYVKKIIEFINSDKKRPISLPDNIK